MLVERGVAGRERERGGERRERRRRVIVLGVEEEVEGGWEDEVGGGVEDEEGSVGLVVVVEGVEEGGFIGGEEG